MSNVMSKKKFEETLEQMRKAQEEFEKKLKEQSEKDEFQKAFEKMSEEQIICFLFQPALISAFSVGMRVRSCSGPFFAIGQPTSSQSRYSGISISWKLELLKFP